MNTEEGKKINIRKIELIDLAILIYIKVLIKAKFKLIHSYCLKMFLKI